MDFDVSRFTSVDVAVASFVGMVLSEARTFIPMRVLKNSKAASWLNDACRNVILHEKSCEGTSEYIEAVETRTHVLRAEYISKMWEELHSLPKMYEK